MLFGDLSLRSGTKRGYLEEQNAVPPGRVCSLAPCTSGMHNVGPSCWTRCGGTALSPCYRQTPQCQGALAFCTTEGLQAPQPDFPSHLCTLPLAAGAVFPRASAICFTPLFSHCCFPAATLMALPPKAPTLVLWWFLTGR